MTATDPGSAREEAERLVATLLAAVRLAAAGAEGGTSWGPLGGVVSSVLGHAGNSTGAGLSTGTAECCICPLCRAIVALRDPSPEFAERLATGAGDLAAGVASLLRAFASAQAAPTSAADPTAEAAASGRSTPVWQAATRSRHDSPSAPEGDAWSAATRAEEAPVPAAAPPGNAAGPAATEKVPAMADRPVVPAARAPGDMGESARGA